MSTDERKGRTSEGDALNENAIDGKKMVDFNSTIEKWSQNIQSMATVILRKWRHLEPESAQ